MMQTATEIVLTKLLNMSFPPLPSEIFERPPDLSGLECELATALPIDFMPVRQS
jgi:hypothetical protein